MEGDDDLIETDDYYAWLGLSKNVSRVTTPRRVTRFGVLYRCIINRTDALEYS